MQVKLSWTLLLPARVQPLYGAGRKESSGTRLGAAEPSAVPNSICRAELN